MCEQLPTWFYSIHNDPLGLAIQPFFYLENCTSILVMSSQFLQEKAALSPFLQSTASCNCRNAWKKTLRSLRDPKDGISILLWHTVAGGFVYWHLQFSWVRISYLAVLHLRYLLQFLVTILIPCQHFCPLYEKNSGNGCIHNSQYFVISQVVI